MAKKISTKIKRQAVQDYLSSGETLRVVSERNSMSVETLRKAVGKRVRTRGKASRPADPKTIQRVRAAYNKASKAKAPNGCKRWTAAEDSLLRDAVYENMSVRETCKLLGRSSVAVYGRKHWLIGQGFINEDRRFIVEKGIKRTRRPMETQPVIEAVIQRPEGDLVYTKDHVMPQSTAKQLDLDTLAKMVKEYGVNVTISYNDGQMEVKMSS